MRYLITGKGIVGKYLVKHLVEHGNPDDKIVWISRQHRYTYEDHPDKDSEVYLLECYGNLLYPTDRLITQYRPHIIIHAAGNGIQNSSPKNLWQANVDTTFNLLEGYNKLDFPAKFIYCSSIVANKPKNLYGVSKLTGEHLVTQYKGLSIRFPAVVGAGNSHGVLKDIVKKMMDTSVWPYTLKLINNSIKPMVYAGQLAKKIVLYANLDNKLPNVVNFCPDDAISVQNIAREVIYIMCKHKDIDWQENKKEIVKPVHSFYTMYSSKVAVRKGIRDILREDYNYAG